MPGVAGHVADEAEDDERVDAVQDADRVAPCHAFHTRVSAGLARLTVGVRDLVAG